jgi:hypothetical protein
MPRNVLVVPVDDGFAVKIEDDEDAVSIHPSEREALEAGRAAAQTEQGDLLVLDDAGTVRWTERREEEPPPPPQDEPAAGP